MLNNPHTPKNFRADINGLRAWAVVAVILYHFDIPGFGGGFSGVDVFFVISGFLMTSIVVTGLEHNAGFSVARFYLARARRIFPALIALCLTVLIIGWFYLVPSDYMTLGTQTVFSLAFLSNFKYWKETGYFDAASHEKWLLHTWSLSVEWQFYLLFPLVLLALWKWRPGRTPLAILMVSGFVCSLALSIILTPSQPSAAFFLLPTRAWEMLSGGLIYLLAPKLQLPSRLRAWLEATGFALILAATFLLDASDQWPGWHALLPVSGATIILLAARQASVWSGSVIAQWLGTRSYSLYLWHWPIVVALAYLEVQHRALAICAGLALTVLLGHLSHRLVEVPARRWLTQGHMRTSGAVLAGLTMLVAVPPALIRLNDGIAGRFPSTVERVSGEASNQKPQRALCFTQKGVESRSCLYGGSQLRAILIGDSHADAVTTALAAAVPEENGGIMDWSYIGCPTLRGVKYVSPQSVPDERCGEFLEWAMKKLAHMPKDIPLVIVNRASSYALGHKGDWKKDTNIPSVYFTEPYDVVNPIFLKEFAQRLTDTACELAKDRPVYLVRPIPEMSVDVPKSMSRAMARGHTTNIFVSTADYRQRHEFVLAAQDAAHERCGVKLLDPLPYLCANGRCPGAKAGRPLYYDQDHLSEYGNKFLVPMFAEVFASNPESSDRRNRF